MPAEIGGQIRSEIDPLRSSGAGFAAAPGIVRQKIGECLVRAGLLSEADLGLALAEHRRSGERLGAVVVRMQLATAREIAREIARQLGFPHLDLAQSPPDPSAVVLVPKALALKRTCIAVAVDRKRLTVAMPDPLLYSLVQDLEFQTGYRIVQVVSTSAEIVEAIHTWYPDRALTRVPVGVPISVPTGAAASMAVGTQDANLQPWRTPRPGGDAAPPDAGSSASAPMVDLFNLVLKSALERRASDIHIEPGENGTVVRHRLDGLLTEVLTLPTWVHDGLVARIKILAAMDIAEKRLPQDGRIRVTSDDGLAVDIRASTLPTIRGEKFVLRVLDQRKGVPPLADLGFSVGALEQMRALLRRPHGMLLVVGPTGSGKTTTLCSALASLRSERTNITTIEDPVEYELPGVNQTQINPRIDLTFASALRSILRQDPDVVLVGEIRDGETAKIAMQAAQTGHLVLSTLHTDDAPSCVTRLADLGTEPYVAASTLIGVVAQRLVRRLCTECRRPYQPDGDTLRAMRIAEAEAEAEAEAGTFHRSTGCAACAHTGYRGRVGIYEVMPVSTALRRLIAEQGSEARLREAALDAGMISLAEDGLAKARAGITSPRELLRVVADGSRP